MIEKLVLKKFGRFEDRTFPFRDSVVFYGPNESGKTTIFDALFTSLCRVPRQGDHKKDIYQRYDDRMDAEIVPEDLQESFDLGEFKDLYSIRSGDVSLSFGDDSSWADAVKTALFSGGIDPAVIAVELESDASDKSTLKHNREITEKKRTISDLQAKKLSRDAEREQFIDRGKKSDELKKVLDSITGAIEACVKEIDGLEASIAVEEKILNRNRLEDSLLLLSKREELEISLASYPLDLEISGARARTIENDMAGLRGEREALREESARREEALRAKESERSDLEMRHAKFTPAAQGAGVLLARIGDFQGDPSRWMKPVTEWNNVLVATIVAVGVVSLVLGVAVHHLFFFGLLALLGFAAARHRKDVEDPTAIDRFTTQIRDEFRNVSGVSLRSDGLTGVAEELRTVIHDQKGLMEAVARLTGEIEKARADVATDGRSLKGLTDRLQSADDDLALLMREKGVTTVAEMAKRLADRNLAADQQKDIVEKLKSRIEAAGFMDERTFDLDVRRQLADADSQGIPRKGRPPAEIRQLKNLLSDARTKLSRIEGEKKKLEVECARLEGSTISFGIVLDELLATEQEIARINEEIADLELNKRGASLAAGIFRTMANDSGAMLGQLAAEMQQTFEGLLAVPRTITVETFNSETISAVDAGGTMRPVSHLSKGTRDTLTFAARLTLAMKADPAGEKRLLVLDEPFTSLDPERTSSALRLVRRLQDERGWQVVLFTKDPGLADGAMAELKDPVRHDL